MALENEYRGNHFRIGVANDENGPRIVIAQELDYYEIQVIHIHPNELPIFTAMLRAAKAELRGAQDGE